MGVNLSSSGMASAPGVSGHGGGVGGKPSVSTQTSGTTGMRVSHPHEPQPSARRQTSVTSYVGLAPSGNSGGHAASVGGSAAVVGGGSGSGNGPGGGGGGGTSGGVMGGLGQNGVGGSIGTAGGVLGGRGPTSGGAAVGGLQGQTNHVHGGSIHGQAGGAGASSASSGGVGGANGAGGKAGAQPGKHGVMQGAMMSSFARSPVGMSPVLSFSGGGSGGSGAMVGR